MGRSAVMMCATLGMLIGGFVPTMWGASSLGLQSLLFSGVGGAAGVWAGLRIAE
ncbi:MAG TPA: hypothetical protein VGH92_09860 [Gaiellaceae bacterium]|jgi:hypothetical protein